MASSELMGEIRSIIQEQGRAADSLWQRRGDGNWWNTNDVLRMFDTLIDGVTETVDEWLTVHGGERNINPAFVAGVLFVRMTNEAVKATAQKGNKKARHC